MDNCLFFESVQFHRWHILKSCQRIRYRVNAILTGHSINLLTLFNLHTKTCIIVKSRITYTLARLGGKPPIKNTSPAREYRELLFIEMSTYF